MSKTEKLLKSIKQECLIIEYNLSVYNKADDIEQETWLAGTMFHFQKLYDMTIKLCKRYAKMHNLDNKKNNHDKLINKLTKLNGHFNYFKEFKLIIDDVSIVFSQPYELSEYKLNYIFNEQTEALNMFMKFLDTMGEGVCFEQEKRQG